MKNRNRGQKLDMEKIYEQLDSGRTVRSVAEEWGVCTATLYRHHQMYQAEIEKVCKETEPSLPPLPGEMADW